jgi:LPXTG-motif cell wall-anchored protein
MSAGPIAGIVAAGLALAVLLWLLLKRRRRSTIRSALAAVAIEHIKDVVVPEGIDG